MERGTIASLSRATPRSTSIATTFSARRRDTARFDAAVPTSSAYPTTRSSSSLLLSNRASSSRPAFAAAGSTRVLLLGEKNREMVDQPTQPQWRGAKFGAQPIQRRRGLLQLRLQSRQPRLSPLALLPHALRRRHRLDVALDAIGQRGRRDRVEQRLRLAFVRGKPPQDDPLVLMVDFEPQWKFVEARMRLHRLRIGFGNAVVAQRARRRAVRGPQRQRGDDAADDNQRRLARRFGRPLLERLAKLVAQRGGA